MAKDNQRQRRIGNSETIVKNRDSSVKLDVQNFERSLSLRALQILSDFSVNLLSLFLPVYGTQRSFVASL